MPDPEEEAWEQATEYEAFEVNRQGDNVYLSLSNREGVVNKMEFSPADAFTIGVALAHASQETEESK